MDLSALLDRWKSGQAPPPPVARLLGIELVDFGDERGIVALEATERHHNAMGTLHGGILGDLADVAMGVAMATTLHEGESFTTLVLQVHYFRKVIAGRLVGEGRVVRRGRTTAYCECEIVDENETLVAKAGATCRISASPVPP